MVTLYSYQGSGNCYKVRLLLTQLGVPFRVEEIDIVAGEGASPAHRARNPFGKVPVVLLEDGSHLSESNAILIHFARATPLWPDEPRLQDETLQWLFFEQNAHEPNIATSRHLIHTLKQADRHGPLLRDKARRGQAALQAMADHLSARSFFVGERYTIADIALYAYTHVAHEGGFDLAPLPAVRAWLDRVAAQPGHITLDRRC